MISLDESKKVLKVSSICDVRDWFKKLGIPKPTERLILMYYFVDVAASNEISPGGTEKFFKGRFKKALAEKIVAETNLILFAKRSKAARQSKEKDEIENIFQEYKKVFEEYTAKLK